MGRQPPNREAGVAMPWLAAIVVGALIVVGGGAYALTGGFSSEEEPSAATRTSPSAAKASKQSPAEPTLEEMLATVKSGSDQIVCTYQHEGAEHTMHIKTFHQFRIDFQGTDDNDSGHLLRDGNTAHVWQSGAAVGISMPVVPNSAPEGAPQDPADLTPEDLRKYGDGTPVSCKPYSGDQSVYSLPESVSFKPFTEVAGPIIP